MATIIIDGNSYQVEDGQNLLQACLSLGLNLPYFCWHPALGSVGACRQCALVQYQDENDQRGRLITACMTPVADGQILSLEADNAVNFRAGVIETLMTNHPHDCPVCEEGGECHLQDMTVMSGHHKRRYHGLKRTFSNQQLGPFIGHEMNRCITCYRCIRYYRDYAGGEDLHALASRNKTYFGRFEDGALESEFSGNLVEVCPTGVFTDKTLSVHYSRKWDLQCAPSVCVHCSLGCNTSPGERYGVLKRIQNRYNPEINGYFLCDRGRFGYGFVNHPDRPRTPMLKKDKECSDIKESTNSANHLNDWQGLSASQGLDHFRQLLEDDSVCWIGIGSPRATLESNQALQKLVGKEHFFSGLSRREELLNRAMLQLMGSGQAEVVSMGQVELADAILILGEDITQTAPRLALSVRQAIRSIGRAKAATIGAPPWQDQAVQIAGQSDGYPLYLSHSCATKLDKISTTQYRAAPLEQARLGFAVAHAIYADAPAVTGLTKQQSQLAEQIATDLIQAEHPLIISGSGSKCPELIAAAEQVIAALNKVRGKLKEKAANHSLPWLSLVFRECNSLGLAVLNRKNSESSLNDAFGIVAQQATATEPGGENERGKKPQIAAIILENDLYTRATKSSADTFFSNLKHTVVIDYLPGNTLQRADLILPTATFAESLGVIVNNEGRGQSLFPVYPAPEGLRMSWQWLGDASVSNSAADSNQTEPVNREQLLQASIEAEPMLAELAAIIEADNPRFAGLKMARMTQRASGRTAMRANISVHEPKQPEDNASALAYTMEGVPAPAMADHTPGGGMMPFSWYPGWNSNQSLHKFQQEIGGPVEGPVTDAKLLLTSQQESGEAWHTPAKKPRGKADHLLLQPVAQIFGSDELSMQADAVIERSDTPHIGLHPEDAKAHNIRTGDLVQVTIEGEKLQLPVNIDPNQAKRLALISDSHPELQGLPDDQGNIWITLRSLGPNPIIASDRRQADV